MYYISILIICLTSIVEAVYCLVKNCRPSGVPAFTVIEIIFLSLIAVLGVLAYFCYKTGNKKLCRFVFLSDKTPATIGIKIPRRKK